MAETREIWVDRIEDYTGLVAQKAGMQFACCAHALHRFKRGVGSQLHVVEGKAGRNFGKSLVSTRVQDKDDFYVLMWDESSIDIEKAIEGITRDESTEYGAEALALAIATNRTGASKATRSIKIKGGGFDYWVTKGTLFHGEKYRVEISGIGTDDADNSDIRQRIKTKLKQVSNSDTMYPFDKGMAIVVVFNRLVAYMVWNDA